MSELTTIALQPGPQVMAAESPAQVIFYGGAKGGGKSFWLLMEALKWYDRSDRGAIIFRRTYTELKDEGGLWSEACKLYPLLGGEPVESKMTVSFPSGHKVQFRHLQHEKDAQAWNGKNIGDVSFDELTFFTEQQFWILLSCMRAHGDARFRGSCNPDPTSWVAKFVEWYLDAAGFPVPERSGVVRWFGRKDGKLVWFSSREDALYAGVEHPMSFTFIAAKLTDNPALLKKSPQYLANLKALGPVEQARFLGGNWKVRAASGDYFQEPWFPVWSSNPLEAVSQPKDKDIVRWFWTCDFAGTPVEGCQVPGVPKSVLVTDDTEARRDADWSVFILWAVCKSGELIIWDVYRYRDSSGAIEWALRKHVGDERTRTRNAPVVLWEDPAQAGKHQIRTYGTILRGVSRLVVTPSLNPLDVASAGSRHVFGGKVWIRDRCKNRDDFMRALEAFPSSEHDDDVSALGLGVVYVQTAPAHVGGKVEGQPPLSLGPARNDVRINPRWRTVL